MYSSKKLSAPSNTQSKIIYTFTDEAPALATLSLYPLIKDTFAAFHIDLELLSISLASRVLAACSEHLPESQQHPDNLKKLAELVLEPNTCVIKLPNISASVSQLKECIQELQSLGYDIPHYPENPTTPNDHKIHQMYQQTLGSAVNPKLRVGNSDRKIPPVVKKSVSVNPHSMGEWQSSSLTHVSSMKEGDFYDSEKSLVSDTDLNLKVVFVPDSSAPPKTLLENFHIASGDVVDGASFSIRHFAEFIAEQKEQARDQGVIFSLHLKATMMKVSDPVIFGQAIQAYFADFFAKHQTILDELKVDPRQGLADLIQKIRTHPQGSVILDDLNRAIQEGPELSMVNSDTGITNFHVSSDVIIDASMAAMIRGGGKLWNAEGEAKDCKAIIPDRSYRALYQETIDFCKKEGAFDPTSMGSVSNLGLMAFKAEEYGSHPRTFISESKGSFQLINQDTGKILWSHNVEKGDIWRLCHTRGVAIEDWIQCALKKATDFYNNKNETQTIFWLDNDRAHDHILRTIVKQRLHQSGLAGEILSTIDILPHTAACQETLKRTKRGQDTLTVTGNVLRDYITDLFPILEVGTSAKMLSTVNLLGGGKLIETGSGGSAPKHVEQFLSENHLRWNSLGEYLALGEAVNFIAEQTQHPDHQFLASALIGATDDYVLCGYAPSRKCREIDTRRTHILWFNRLMIQIGVLEDGAPAPSSPRHPWAKYHRNITGNLGSILMDIATSEGGPISKEEIGGYYLIDHAKATALMRPSKDFNQLVREFFKTTMDSTPKASTHFNSSSVLKIATRRSTLALWQAHLAELILLQGSLRSELMPMTSLADQHPHTPLKQLATLKPAGSKASFVSTLESSLLDGRADVAVHSLKDLPMKLPPPLDLPCFLSRHSPYDVALIKKTSWLDRISLDGSILTKEILKSLPLRLATSSLRRQAFLKFTAPSLNFTDIRGNISTRIKKTLSATDLDGLLLSQSAILRMKQTPRFSELLEHFMVMTVDPEILVPSPGQGTIALEMKADHPTYQKVATLSCRTTQFISTLERSITALLGGHCGMPLGCYARLKPGDNKDSSSLLDLWVRVALAHPSGSSMIHSLHCYPVTEQNLCHSYLNSHLFDQIHEAVYSDLMTDGAEKIYSSLGYPLPPPPRTRP